MTCKELLAMSMPLVDENRQTPIHIAQAVM
jgi:hypothetical protein